MKFDKAFWKPQRTYFPTIQISAIESTGGHAKEEFFLDMVMSVPEKKIPFSGHRCRQ